MSERPELTGHLWIQALATGLPLRFQAEESGLLVFGDAERVYITPEDLPLPYRAAAEEVRHRLDRDTLIASVDDATSLSFYGVATVYRGVEYRWSDVPAFLGVDVWSDDAARYLPPDAASSAYRRLGLATPPVLEQEAAAEYADLESYVTGEPPALEDLGGPAGKVVVRDKSGGRGEAVYDLEVDQSSEEAIEAEEVVDGFVDEGYVDGLVWELGGEAEASVDEVVEAAVNDLIRRRYSVLYTGGDAEVDERRLRSTVAEEVSRLLG